MTVSFANFFIRFLQKIIAVDSSSNSMSKPQSHKHEFSVVTKDRVYNLFAESKQIKNAWLRAFNQVITLKNKFKYELEKMQKDSYRSINKQNIGIKVSGSIAVLKNERSLELRGGPRSHS